MATNEGGIGSGEETTRTTDEFEAKPEGGGCLKFGWGCLPVLVAGLGLLPLIGF